MFYSPRAVLCTAALLAAAAVPAAAAGSSYKLVKTIDLPGDKGGHGDWTTFNPKTGMVWLSQSPDHNVVVIDTKTNTVAHVIPDVANSNGIAFAGEYAFAADNDSNTIVVIDQKTFEKVATLNPEGKGPDTVNFLSKEGRIYTSSNSDDATVFSDKKPFKMEAKMRLQPDPAKDGPDIAVYVPSKDKIYQPNDNMIDVIDAKTGKILGTWDVGIKGSAKAAAFDGKTNHLIVGTGDKKVLVIDADTGKVVATVPVAGAIDATIVDETARRAYEGDKSGVVDVIDLDTNKVVDTIPSEPKMHTLAVDTKTHAVYVYRNESNKVDVFEMAKPS
ncbi:MAG TPA: YncE family protein [Lichenihabitans sp.]|jgi:DNA-binding beta-propeller fold protein YncE|nr:YncE family protein [Lichenihabitans sp.]